MEKLDDQRGRRVEVIEESARQDPRHLEVNPQVAVSVHSHIFSILIYYVFYIFFIFTLLYLEPRRKRVLAVLFYITGILHTRKGGKVARVVWRCGGVYFFFGFTDKIYHIARWRAALDS